MNLTQQVQPQRTPYVKALPNIIFYIQFIVMAKNVNFCQHFPVKINKNIVSLLDI